MVSDSHNIVCFRIVTKEVYVPIPDNRFVYDGTLHIVYLFSAAMIVQTRAKPSLLELCRVQPIFTFSRLQRYGNNLCNTVAEIASALVFGQKSENLFTSCL